MVLIFFLHGVIVGSCYTSYMKRYLQFSIVVNTFRSPSCLKIWYFVQDIRYVHWVLVQLKLSIKERNTGLKRLRMCMCMCMHLGCQYQVATKECKLRCFKGVKEIRSVTRIFQSRGSLCVKQRVRAKLSCRSPRYVLLEVTKKKLMKGGHRILESLIKLQDKTVNRHNWINFEFEKSQIFLSQRLSLNISTLFANFARLVDFSRIPPNFARVIDVR